MGSFFISVILYTVFIVNSDSSTARNLNLNFTFQLRKCCPKGSVYRHFLDICSPSLENKVSTLNITLINQQEFNESVTFKITDSQGLDDCPDGFIGTTQEEFSVFNNGSAQVTTKDDILVVDWNDYCIDYVQRTNQSLKSIFLRHCTVDPCWNSELPCIKKCCPLNEILDRDARQCRSPGEKSTYDILTAVTHETGNLWRDESSFTLVYGTGLKCVDDQIRQTTTSWPVVNGNGSFVNFEALIDSDRFTDQYCIDYIDANDTKKVLTTFLTFNFSSKMTS